MTEKYPNITKFLRGLKGLSEGESLAFFKICNRESVSVNDVLKICLDIKFKISRSRAYTIVEKFKREGLIFQINDSGKKYKWDDGFGDYYNKYCWSMAVCGDELWMGTSNNQLIKNSSSILPDYDSKGCEVWHYDGENLTASVKDDTGEISNGFGNMSIIGARSMIEYPVGSGNVIVGTYSIKSFIPEVKEIGCEVWIRYP